MAKHTRVSEPRRPRVGGAAIAALVVGALLIGGTGTFAFWRDAATTAGPGTIKLGTLTAGVTGPVITTVPIATIPSYGKVPTGAVGAIPGVQAQRLTYTVTNTGSTRAPARMAVRVLAPVGSGATAAWNAVRATTGFSATVSINGGTATTIPAASITATGIDYSVANAGVIQPAASATVAVTISLGTLVPGIATLRPYDSTTLNATNLLALAPVFTLTQVPRST